MALPNEDKKDALGKGKSNPKPDSVVEVKVDRMTVNVFFDGTANNYINTDARTPSRGGSYANAYSNVAWLYTRTDKNKADSVSVYIEGIGTLKGKKDSTYSKATGWSGLGGYGMVARAMLAFTEIKRALKAKKTKGRDQKLVIASLTINVFGFSRGAAAARYFVSTLHSDENPWTHLPKRTLDEQVNDFADHSQDTVDDQGVKIANFSVNFIGLYDTVSSVGNNPRNDIVPYRQQIKRGTCRFVFHLTARDEYREHFALNRISTATGGKFGYEMQIPWAHSDIGGGYNHYETEALRWTSTMAKGYNQHLQEGGWYRKEDIYEQYHDRPNRQFWDHWTKTRTISNEYHKVGLKIMVDMIGKFIQPVELSFKDNLPINTSDSTIHFIQSKLNQMAQARYKSGIQGTDDIVQAGLWPAGNDWSKEIYRRYFHVSSDFHSIGMSPRINGNGQPERLRVSDHG